MSLAGLLEWLILPPAGALLLVLLGLLLWHRRLGLALAGAGLALLYAASTSVLAFPVIEWLQYDGALDEPAIRQAPAQAIVVLGAGQRYTAPEYGGLTVNEFGLERLRYAAHLQRLTGLPIVPTGGSGPYDDVPGAVLMRRVLQDDFAAVVPWVEDRSLNTMENARLVAKLLQQHDIGRVFVVTHALHMPRALWAFRRTPLEVIPAPTGFVTTDVQPGYALHWIPRASVLSSSHLAAHEAVGRLWYRLRY